MKGGLRSAALRRLGIALRAETSGDADWLGALFAETRAGDLAALAWPPSAKAAFLANQFALQRHHVATHHPSADRLLVVRTATGARIGRLYVDRTMRPWRIVDVALLPDAQGGGVGQALLRALQAAAPDGLDLHVAHDNPHAARLYARLGFRDAFAASPTHRRMTWTAQRIS